MENLPYVDVEALLRESQTIREEATRLMRALRLVEQLQQYGELEMAGSYRWDLMLRADLDFYVINPAVDLDMALEALNAFVRRGDCHCFGFIESVRGKPWESGTPESYPVGYYLGMSRDFGGRNWKVETWFLRAPYPHPDWLLKPMTEEARRTILRLKHLRQSGHLHAETFHLYEAVLLGGAREPEEVHAWLDRDAGK